MWAYLKAQFSKRISLQEWKNTLDESGPQPSKMIPEKETLLELQKNIPLKVSGPVEELLEQKMVACPSLIASNLMLELFTMLIHSADRAGRRMGGDKGREEERRDEGRKRRETGQVTP